VSIPSLPSGLPTNLPSLPSGLPSGLPSIGSSGGGLASSKLFGVTKLTQAQLCGALSRSEASRILGTTTSAPTYANRLGLGITCEWFKAGTSGNDELYVGISTLIPWKGAQAGDSAQNYTPSTIDGHPAFLADTATVQLGYALVHVALGGDDDPVAEYRAPTLAIAKNLATVVTPRLIALAGG
jgi:hypothetical protein